MPDFTARIVSSGDVTMQTWLDAATASDPTRINPHPEHPHKYWKVRPNALPEFRCTVGGVEGPLDTALGGRLFKWSWAEVPGTGAPPPITPTPGSSSIAVANISGVAMPLGHYCINIWRDNGGSILIPFEVQS
jgi:hypothetical protein